MGPATLTKQAAAYRLILSGIRMIDGGEDPVATHVVAASAMNLLRELLAESKIGLADNLLQAGLYKSAKDRMDGKDTSFPKGEQFEPILEEIIKAIEEGHVNGPEDIQLIGSLSDRSMIASRPNPFTGCECCDLVSTAIAVGATVVLGIGSQNGDLAMDDDKRDDDKGPRATCSFDHLFIKRDGSPIPYKSMRPKRRRKGYLNDGRWAPGYGPKKGPPSEV